MTISAEKLKVQVHGRLWRLIAKLGDDECWPWTGPKTKGGYGLFGISGRYTTAHRAVFEEINGKLRKHFYALHTCDNPACCNPKHLWAGTQKQNVQDMIAKGRLARHGQAGERHWKAKLTDKQIRAIRREYDTGDFTQWDLAEKYGVGQNHISRIVLRKNRQL